MIVVSCWEAKRGGKKESFLITKISNKNTEHNNITLNYETNFVGEGLWVLPNRSQKF